MLLIQLLKLTGLGCITVGLIHIGLGVEGELLLGAQLSAATIADPVLDSQNRFYGAAFMLYGVLFYFCTRDLTRYQPVLHLCLLMFWVAGAARLVSIAVLGWPSQLILWLLVIELLLPPVLYYLSLKLPPDPPSQAA